MDGPTLVKNITPIDKLDPDLFPGKKTYVDNINKLLGVYKFDDLKDELPILVINNLKRSIIRRLKTEENILITSPGILMSISENIHMINSDGRFKKHLDGIKVCLEYLVSGSAKNLFIYRLSEMKIRLLGDGVSCVQAFGSAVVVNELPKGKEKTYEDITINSDWSVKYEGDLNVYKILNFFLCFIKIIGKDVDYLSENLKNVYNDKLIRKPELPAPPQEARRQDNDQAPAPPQVARRQDNDQAPAPPQVARRQDNDQAPAPPQGGPQKGQQPEPPQVAPVKVAPPPVPVQNKGPPPAQLQKDTVVLTHEVYIAELSKKLFNSIIQLNYPSCDNVYEQSPYNIPYLTSDLTDLCRQLLVTYYNIKKDIMLTKALSNISTIKCNTGFLYQALELDAKYNKNIFMAMKLFSEQVTIQNVLDGKGRIDRAEVVNSVKNSTPVTGIVGAYIFIKSKVPADNIIEFNYFYDNVIVREVFKEVYGMDGLSYFSVRCLDYNVLKRYIEEIDWKNVIVNIINLQLEYKKYEVLTKWMLLQIALLIKKGDIDSFIKEACCFHYIDSFNTVFEMYPYQYTKLDKPGISYLPIPKDEKPKYHISESKFDGILIEKFELWLRLPLQTKYFTETTAPVNIRGLYGELRNSLDSLDYGRFIAMPQSDKQQLINNDVKRAEMLISMYLYMKWSRDIQRAYSELLDIVDAFKNMERMIYSDIKELSDRLTFQYSLIKYIISDEISKVHDVEITKSDLDNLSKSDYKKNTPGDIEKKNKELSSFYNSIP